MRKLLSLLVFALVFTSCSGNGKINVEIQKFKECYNEVEYDSFERELDQKVRDSILDNLSINNLDYEGTYKLITNNYGKYSFKAGGEKLIHNLDEQSISTYSNDSDNEVLVYNSKGKQISSSVNGNMRYTTKSKNVVQSKENGSYYIINELDNTYTCSNYNSYNLPLIISDRIRALDWPRLSVKCYIDDNVYTWIFKEFRDTFEEFIKVQIVFSTYSVSYLYQYSIQTFSVKENVTVINKQNTIESYEITLKDVNLKRVELKKYKEV